MSYFGNEINAKKKADEEFAEAKRKAENEYARILFQERMKKMAEHKFSGYTSKAEVAYLANRKSAPR